VREALEQFVAFGVNRHKARLGSDEGEILQLHFVHRWLHRQVE
jgi:hypothetical protein